VDRFARSWRLLLGLALAGPALAGCHAPPLNGIGKATEGATTTAIRIPAPDGAAPPCPIPADFTTKLARVGPDSFVSWGHAGGRYAGTVYVTPESKPALAVTGDGVDFPVGTQVVLVAVDRTTHKPGPTLYMQKNAPRAAGAAPSKGAAVEWEYGVLEATSTNVEGAALCARCHAEAAHDGVFGLGD